jgi:transcriptional antiterminator RfaH
MSGMIEHVALRRQLMSVSSARWYAVYCQSGAEWEAAHQLRNQGFSVFLPWSKKTRKLRHTLEEKNIPLFPSYLFVNMNIATDRWRSVNGTRGVKTLLMSSSQTPLPLPVGIIEHLEKQCSVGGFIEVDGAAHASYAPGSPIEIIGGPLTGSIGTCVESTSSIIKVLLDILGRDTVVSLPIRQAICA